MSDTNTTFEVNIKGFKSKAQAEEFISWYSEQGEQDAGYWFEARKEEGTLDCNFMPVIDTYPLVWIGNTLIAKVDPT